MRRQTTILLLLLPLLGETFTSATAAVETSSSSSSRYTYSGLFVHPGEFSLKNRCWSSWSTAQLVQRVSPSGTSAASEYEKTFACAFSPSISTPGGKYTFSSKLQQQHLFHAEIRSTFLNRCLAAASTQQHWHRSPFLTSTEVAVTGVTLSRSSLLRLLPQKKRLQGQFLLLLSCPALLQHDAFVAAPCRRGWGTVGAAAPACIVTNKFSALLAAMSKPEASLTESIVQKKIQSTAPQSRANVRRTTTVVGLSASTDCVITGYSAWKGSSAMSVALRKVRKTKYDERHPPVVLQPLKQQSHDFSRAVASSALPPFSYAALTSPGRADISGSGHQQTLRYYLSFLCTARLGGATSGSHSTSSMCHGSKALLSAGSRGSCDRNRVCCTLLGNGVSLTARCGRVSGGGSTLCTVARESSKDFDHEARLNRSGSGTRISVNVSNVDSRGCSSDGSDSVDSYICLTSPEAARVFSTCWRRAGCPALLPGMLVCIGEGTRAAAERALRLDFHLYMKKRQPPLQYQRLHQFFHIEEGQQQNDEQKPCHVFSNEKGKEVDQTQHQLCRKENALLSSPLTHRICGAADFAGYPVSLTSSFISSSPVSTGAAAGACSPAPVRLSDHVSYSQSVSTAVPADGELRAPAEAVVAGARPAVDENNTHDVAAEVDTRPAKDLDTYDAHADADWSAVESVGRAAILTEQCSHKTTVAARADARGEVNDSVALRLQQSFLPFRPSSSCGASLAAELPPRPPLLQHVHAAVCALLRQQGQQQLPRDVEEHLHGLNEIHRVIECINTAITRRNEHTHPGCAYTQEEAVGCAVKVLHQEGRELKNILLQRCCPCWLQTRVLWPASALARPTLQDALQQRPLQHLQQYSFAAIPAAVRLHFDMLPLQQVAVRNVNKDEATRTCGDFGTPEALVPSAVSPSVVTMTEMPLVQRRHCRAASTPARKGSCAAAGEVTSGSSAGPSPKEHTEIPAANRLFVVDRYNTYTTAQVMLTATERHALLRCMQKVLCSSKGHGRAESSGHTSGKEHHSDIDSVNSNSCTMNTDKESKRTSDTPGGSSRSTETTDRGLERDVSCDLVTSICNTDNVLGNASGAGNNRSNTVCSSPEGAHIAYAGDLSDNSSADVGGSGGCEESRQSKLGTAEADGVLREADTVEGLVIVVLASPSAVWAWTGNGLPVSPAACCTERPLPSYTAVHASTDGESRSHQRSHSRVLLREPSTDVGSDETSCSEVGGSSASSLKTTSSAGKARGLNCSKKVTVESSTNGLESSGSDTVVDDSVSDGASTSGSGRTNGRKNLKPADSRVVGEAARAKRGRKRLDAAFLEADEFVRLLQNCQQVIQEGRRQRDQEQQHRKRRRLVALCIGPTTASAAKQAGFCETLTGEHGSVAALADLVEGCVLECCSRYCGASEKRCTNGRDRVKSSNNKQDQTKESDTRNHGSSSCFMPEGNGRKRQRFWTENKTPAAREDEWSSRPIHSSGNDTTDENSSGRLEAETNTGTSKRVSANKQDTSAREEQRRPVREKSMRILVLLTRAEGRNDAVVQELLERKELQIQAVDLKRLVSKDAQHPSYQQLNKAHQYFHLPGRLKSMQSRNGTPVVVIEAPLLRTQSTQGLFKREQQRLTAALMQLQTVQQVH